MEMDKDEPRKRNQEKRERKVRLCKEYFFFCVWGAQRETGWFCFLKVLASKGAIITGRQYLFKIIPVAQSAMNNSSRLFPVQTPEGYTPRSGRGVERAQRAREVSTTQNKGDFNPNASLCVEHGAGTEQAVFLLTAQRGQQGWPGHWFLVASQVKSS
jgi:hypothetical protein